MMKIKILACCAGLKFSYTAGETVDADDATAKDLIRAGYAKAVGGKQSAEKPDTASAAAPLKEAKADGKGNNTADGGTGKPG